MVVEKINDTSLPEKAEHSISNQNWVEAPEVNAGFSIRHDGTSIHLFYQVEESQVRAVNTGFNSPVWEDSCVEFFFSLDGDENYYNFEINAIGTVLGAYGMDRHQRNQLSDNLLSQVKTVPSLRRDPIEGLEAHANFYKCGDKLKQPHFLSWKPVLTPTPDFHTPHYFGQLSFL